MYLPIQSNDDTFHVSKKSVRAIQKEVAKSEVDYTKSFDSLKKESSKLEFVLKDTRASLKKSKHKNHSLQVEVFDLLDTRFVKQQTDAIPNDGNCDSLIVTVGNLLQSTFQKDSLYEEVAKNLEEQLKNKDSTLVTKDKQYTEIKFALTKSFEGQQTLIDQNKFLSKEAKRQKFKSKILSAALFIFTGVATNHLIQH
jgi:hypothetical protein